MGPLWAEVCVYACDSVNMPAKVRDKAEKLSSYQKFHGKVPSPRLLLCRKPGIPHVKLTHKSETQAQACFCLSGGSHYPSDCCKILLKSGCRSRDATWEPLLVGVRSAVTCLSLIHI